VPDTHPSEAALAAFAEGRLAPDDREATATHLRTCPECQGRLTPLMLSVAPIGSTAADSPRAQARRVSRDDVPVDDALGSTHVRGPVSETDDTHVSGERPAVTSGHSLHTGDALNRYVILERLGAGGMGEVYTAWDPVLDRKVAVKIIRAEPHERELAGDLTKRLLNEAQALAKLSHPNVVMVHDVGVMDDRIYLAMEFVQGQTLTSWLKETPRSWQQVVEVFLTAGEGLAAAHDVGITHRDFKPDNVVVSSDGRLRVMDFGLAHARAEPKKRDDGSGLRRTITAPGTILGTPAYMSPEALYSKPTDFRSDEFSYCVALFEGLYGVRPFEGTTPGAIAAEIDANRVRAAPADSKVPRRIHQLILKGLRRAPEERFQTMRALLVQLGRTQGNSRRARSFGTVAAIALLSMATVGWLVHRERDRCAHLDDRLAGIWDGAQKQALEKAFLATGRPWAAAAARDVTHRLDDYRAKWLGLRRQACEANTSGDEAEGQTLLCLGRRRAELTAVSQLFTHADGEVVERAVATASALPPLDACTASAPLRRRIDRDELRAGLASIKVQLDASRFHDASETAKDLVARSAGPDDRGARAEARFLEGVAHARLQDYPGAAAMLDEALLQAIELQDDELAARSWVEQVGLGALANLPDTDRKVAFAEAAITRLGAPMELEASLANNRGVLAWSKGRFDDAVIAHTRALGLRTTLLGDQHVLVARSHSNLGTAWKALGQFDQAIAEYRQALAIEEAVLDPSHPAVAETLNNLGNALQGKGEYAEAHAAIERALSIREKAFGPQSMPVAMALTNLGVQLYETHDLPGARTALTRSLAIKEKLSPGSLSLAITLTNLARVEQAEGQWAEALTHERRALELRREKQGPTHVDNAINLAGIGGSQLELGKVTEARSALEAALALQKTSTPDRGTTEYWLARALRVAPSPDRARARELVDAALRDLPSTDPLRARVEALR
jgi:tetratricopeptide (TPR) repeat protein/tRNA A-37 threonylcarbamoyl transferase component Bud32